MNYNYHLRVHNITLVALLRPSLLLGPSRVDHYIVKDIMPTFNVVHCDTRTDWEREGGVSSRGRKEAKTSLTNGCVSE